MAEPHLSLLVLKTRQMPELVAFYQTLGLTFTEEKHGSGPIHFAAVMAELVFEIYPLPPEDPGLIDFTRLGFRVANLEFTMKALQDQGTPVKSAPRSTPWGMNAVVSDPDGRPVELYQR